MSLNVCTCLYLSNVVSLFVGLYHCVYVCVSLGSVVLFSCECDIVMLIFFVIGMCVGGLE